MPTAPNLLGTRDQFCGEMFFCRPEGGMVLCAAYIPPMGLHLHAWPGFWHAAAQWQARDWGLGTCALRSWPELTRRGIRASNF